MKKGSVAGSIPLTNGSGSLLVAQKHTDPTDPTPQHWFKCFMTTSRLISSSAVYFMAMKCILLTFSNLGCLHSVNALLVVGPLSAFKQFKSTLGTTCQLRQILLIWTGNGALQKFLKFTRQTRRKKIHQNVREKAPFLLIFRPIFPFSV